MESIVTDQERSRLVQKLLAIIELDRLTERERLVLQDMLDPRDAGSYWTVFCP